MNDETIKILINKIENGLPDIKLRSIATLYTKVTVGIIDYSSLPKFINIPGVLLQWINDNRNRSQPLFKVLTILSYFMKTEEGILIMHEYQALEFFQQYRQFLLEQQPRHDQYTTLLENLSKLLLPLGTQTTKSISRIQAQSIVEAKQEKKMKQQENKEKQRVVKAPKEGIKMSWTVCLNPLGKKQQDELYSLMMELRHSKRQLQFQWLKKIEALIKYWGYKSFRFRKQLINQLTEQFARANLKWLIVDIIKALVIAIAQNSLQLLNQQSNLVCLSGNDKLINKPQVQKVSLIFKKQLFQSIYSHQLLDELIRYNNCTNQSDLFESLLEIGYKFSPKYFQISLKSSIKSQSAVPNIQLLNKNIQYYSINFEKFPQNVSTLLSQTPKEWNLSFNSFPILKDYLSNIQKSQKITYISQYGQDWEFGSNLHNAAEIIRNLQQGVDAIDVKNHNQYIGVYLTTLLTLGVAVERQEPLMSFYPKMKNLIIKIAQNPELRFFLFEEILGVVNSTVSLKYGSRKILASEIAAVVFSEESMFISLFYESFGDEDSLQLWLQISSILIKKNRDFCQLSAYASIFLSLTYHKREKIRNFSKMLIQGLPKSGKQLISLCKLFSGSEQERRKISKDFFGENHEIIVSQIQEAVAKHHVTKKLLKISQKTLQNYIQIIFNGSLEEQIRLNAAKQLLQSLERIELKPNLEQLLIILSQNILKALNQFSSLSHSFISLFIQINGLLNELLSQKYLLKIEHIIKFLQNPLPTKTLQLLLQQVYLYCFQSPFSTDKQSHFITMLYPHIKFVNMKITGHIQTKQPIIDSNEQKQNKSKNTLIMPNYEESLQYVHFIQWLIYSKLNNQPIKLNQTFVNIVEKEIGSIFHANKGYGQLHFLAYGFLFLSRNNIRLPDKVVDYSSPLLSSLLSKDQTSLNCEPIAIMIAIIGSKKSRQFHSLLASNPAGLWKFTILSQIQTIQPSLMELIIKGLIGINYGKEATLILRLVGTQSSKAKLSQFSQSLIMSSCIKFIRQQTDEILRNTSICILTELYRSQKFECPGQQDAFGSITAFVLDQTLKTNELNLILTLIKTMMQKNDSIYNKEGNILKILIQRLVKLLLLPSLNELTGSIVFQILNLITVARRQMLFKLEIVDSAIDFVSNLSQKSYILSENKVRFVTHILDYLFLESKIDDSLSKYILSSTNLIKQLIQICKHEQNNRFTKPLLESIGRILCNLSIKEQDLFLYKINQLLSQQAQTFFHILGQNISFAGQEYLKMVGWMMVIWMRNRESLDSEIGSHIVQAILKSQNPSIVKLVLPFSVQAKVLFIQSKLFQRLLKENNTLIESRMVKQMKDKKKKVKIYQLEQQESKSLNFFLSILSALFYYGDNLPKSEIGQCQGLKKVIIFIEKMYSCGQWDEQTTRSYIKVITNMALSQPISGICSSRFSQNTIMIQEIIGCIIKSQNSDGLVKLSMKMLSVLIHFQSIRNISLRSKVIQELSVKLIKSEQNGDISIEHVMDIIDIFTSFSVFKESNTRLLNDKRLLQVLLRILKLGKFAILQERIIILLANLACFKSNKSTFMSNRDIHKIILGLLEDQQTSYRPALISLLYNILYKNSAAIKLYKRNDVIEVVKKASNAVDNDVSKALLEALLSEQYN